MLLSETMLFVICLNLGLNTGKDSADRRGLTILSCDCIQGGFRVSGFVSRQDKTKTKRMKHTRFTIDV